ncbi:hypothetical protein C0J52_26816 [Blattella germanica]|nr:hypothetical protein C0J52_26816 [Blattella germanica]
MSDRFLLNASFNWLIWSKDPAPSDLETCNLNIDSEVTWATPEMSTIKLFDLYKVNYTRPLISTPSGIWEKTNGLDYHLNEFKYLRRTIFLNHSEYFQVTSIPEGSIEAYLTSTTHRYTDSIAKYNYALIRQLATTFNFT